MRPLYLGWILIATGTQATWAAPPPSMHARDLVISQPGGSATDAAGNQFVTEQAGGYIYCIRPDSSIVVVSQANTIGLPLDPTVDEQRRRLYVIDYVYDRIHLFDLDTLQPISHFGQRKRFDLIGGMCIDAGGMIYVAERGRATVHVVDPVSFKTVRKFGKPVGSWVWSGEMVLTCPTDVAVVDTIAYVMDSASGSNGQSIKMFSMEGRYLGKFGDDAEGNETLKADRLFVTKAGHLLAASLRQGTFRVFQLPMMAAARVVNGKTR